MARGISFRNEGRRAAREKKGFCQGSYSPSSKRKKKKVLIPLEGRRKVVKGPHLGSPRKKIGRGGPKKERMAASQGAPKSSITFGKTLLKNKGGEEPNLAREKAHAPCLKRGPK